MPKKSESSDVELKVRIPRDLMSQIKDFWHEQKLENRKKAVVALLELGLSNGKGEQVGKLKTE